MRFVRSKAEAASVPKIGPVARETGRPFWSVVMPTFNCTDHFEKALRSVLDQDPGPDRMQIAVIDDGSSDARSEEVVRRLAPTRVEFHRQPVNLGLSGSWNACVSRSLGHWVHLLHQDDLVLPGFYERLGRAAIKRPDTGAAFCRYFFIDAAGHHQCSSLLERPTAGILAGWLGAIARGQKIQSPSIVVRREVYEQLGGFRADLCCSLDWEMWVRIAVRFPVWFEPEPLACYRIHAGNESARLDRQGRIIPDIYKALRIMSGYLPAELQGKQGANHSAFIGICRSRRPPNSCGQGTDGREWPDFGVPLNVTPR